MRLCAGQRPGLVEDDRVCVGDRLKILSALDQDLVVTCLAHRGKHGDRHGKLQGTGIVDHKDGQRLRDISGDKPGQDGPAQAVGHQTVRQMGGLRLRGGLQLLGFFDHLHDAVVAAAAHLFADRDLDLALLDHGPGVGVAARLLPDGKGFPGHGRLVHAGCAAGHFSVQRDHGAHADDDGVPHFYLTDRRQHLLPVLCPGPDLIHIEGHGPGKIIHGFLVGPLLQQFSDLQHEHDGVRRREFIPGDGDGDRRRVQDRDLQLSPDKASEAPLQVSGGLPKDQDCPDRCRHKHPEEAPPDCYHDKFLFVFTVQRPAGRRRLGKFHPGK